MAEASKRTLTAETASEAPSIPFVEVRVGADLLIVTAELPDVAPRDLELVATQTTLRLGARGPGRPQYRVALPVNVEPGRYIGRCLNGVVDVTLARAARFR